MYYIKGADKVYGCSEEMLHTLLEKGRITLDVPVSTDQKTWQPLKTLPGFSSSAAAQNTSSNSAQNSTAAAKPTSGTSSSGEKSGGNSSGKPSFDFLQNNNSSASSGAPNNTYSQQQNSTPQTPGQSVPAQQTAVPNNPVQEERWFLSSDGVNAFGPYSASQVVSMIQSGQVYPNNFAWRNGENPAPVASIPSFASYFNMRPANFNAPMNYNAPMQNYNAPMPNYNAPMQPMPNNGYGGYRVSSCSRTTYILLGLFFGYLGIHNFYAGYSGRGAFQLISSLCCIGFIFVPLWSLIEVCTVTTDANGVPFS